MKYAVLFCTEKTLSSTLDRLASPHLASPLRLVTYDLHNVKDTFFPRPIKKGNYYTCPMANILFDTLVDARHEVEREILGADFPKDAVFKIRDWKSAIILAADSTTNTLTDHIIKKMFEQPLTTAYIHTPNKDPKQEKFATIDLLVKKEPLLPRARI